MVEGGTTNNNPNVIASYFVECIEHYNFVPRLVRSDRGSENVVVGGIQRFLRRGFSDPNANQASFQYGTSTRNQRIEAWWSQFRKNRCNWWINFFKDWSDLNQFDLGIGYHKMCMHFCFMGLIQKELDDVKYMWNNYRIRKVRNSESPGGKPVVLFFAPHLSGGTDCSYRIRQSDIDLVNEYCEETPFLGCTSEFLELASIIMQEKDIGMPKNAYDAKVLFNVLLSEIDQL